MNRFATLRGMRVFILIWFGQLVSLVGSGLTEFALGVDLYQRTGSATQFALFYLCFLLPFLLVSPVAGALVDRWNRRLVLILADTGSGLCTLTVALLMVTGHYQTWHLYALVAAISTFDSFQWPAFTASVPLLVPERHLGRADGMLELSWGASRILSPLLAAFLATHVPLYYLFAIDCATFIFAIVVVLAIRIPQPAVSAEGEAAKGSLRQEIAYGWSYIRSRPGLLGLLTVFFLMNFSLGFVQVLFTPMVLSSNSVQTLGVLISAGSAGVVLGGILMIVWGGPRRRVNGVLGLSLMFGLAMISIGFWQVVPLIAGASFVYYLVQPIINGSDEVIWQTKVPADLQGRVLALRRTFEWSSSPLAYAISGPLAEWVFEPLLASNGPLAASVGQIVGVGPGRGIGLLLMLVGALPLLAAAGGYLHPRVRRIEDELPNALIADEDEAAVATGELQPARTERSPGHRLPETWHPAVQHLTPAPMLHPLAPSTALPTITLLKAYRARGVKTRSFMLREHAALLDSIQQREGRYARSSESELVFLEANIYLELLERVCTLTEDLTRLIYALLGDLRELPGRIINAPPPVTVFTYLDQAAWMTLLRYSDLASLELSAEDRDFLHSIRNRNIRVIHQFMDFSLRFLDFYWVFYNTRRYRNPIIYNIESVDIEDERYFYVPTFSTTTDPTKVSGPIVSRSIYLRWQRLHDDLIQLTNDLLDRAIMFAERDGATCPEPRTYCYLEPDERRRLSELLQGFEDEAPEAEAPNGLELHFPVEALKQQAELYARFDRIAAERGRVVAAEQS